MKDIVIPGQVVRRELFILLGCLGAAVLVNLYAVLHFSRPAVELVTQVGFTVCTALAIYLALWVIRLLVLLGVVLYKRARKCIAK